MTHCTIRVHGYEPAHIESAGNAREAGRFVLDRLRGSIGHRNEMSHIVVVEAREAEDAGPRD